MNEFTATAEDLPVFDPGDYQATFDRVEPSKEPGPFGDYLDWYFQILTEDGPAEIMGRSTQPNRYTRETKAREWYEALLGRPVASGEKLVLAKLSGTPCVVTVKVVVNTRGTQSNRIESIRRVARPTRPAPTPVDEPPPPASPRGAVDLPD
jgi:hypothetical protein